VDSSAGLATTEAHDVSELFVVDYVPFLVVQASQQFSGVRIAGHSLLQK
jgi:hypothetical protein